MTELMRREFLKSGAGFGGLAMLEAPRPKEETYELETKEFKVAMCVRFYGRYTSKGFWFDEARRKSSFCVAADGRLGSDCLKNFAGALAVAQYHVRPGMFHQRPSAFRELVRTVDQDDRLNRREPFSRSLPLLKGMVSDIQAFGVEGAGDGAQTVEVNGPWALLRQDLFVNDRSTPFLVLHWKHTLSAIRLVDLIPGEGTQLMVK